MDDELNEAVFFKSSLKDIDLSSCKISSMNVGLDDIKGAILNFEQAIGVARMIGVKIKD
jgi:hypothetical protein